MPQASPLNTGQDHGLHDHHPICASSTMASPVVLPDTSRLDHEKTLLENRSIYKSQRNVAPFNKVSHRLSGAFRPLLVGGRIR